MRMQQSGCKEFLNRSKAVRQLTAGSTADRLPSVKPVETLYTNKALQVAGKPFMDLDKITAAPARLRTVGQIKVPSRGDDLGGDSGVHHRIQ